MTRLGRKFSGWAAIFSPSLTSNARLLTTFVRARDEYNGRERQARALGGVSG
jgi:hypothetical protein